MGIKLEDSLDDSGELWDGLPLGYWIQALEDPEDEARWRAIDALRHIAHPSQTISLGVPDIHYSGWRRESRGLTSGMTLILLSITGTMITVIVLSHNLCDASSIHACLPSPRDRGR